MAELEKVLDHAEDVLASARQALDDLETALAQAEMLQRLLADQGVAAIASAAVVELEGALTATVRLTDEKAVDLAAGLAALENDMEDAADQIETSVGELTEGLDEVVSAFGQLSDAISERFDDVVSGLEDTLQSVDDKLAAQADEIAERLSAGLDGAIAAMTETVGHLAEMAEASTGSVARFIDGVDNSIGKVVDALEQIEQVIEPVRPVLSIMEQVA